MDKVKLTMSRQKALELGLLKCGNCGYPENNHFRFAALDGTPIGDYGLGPCAHDQSCKAYREVPIKGVERC